ncbi:uncharacterized protein LOC113212750 [Frankliniella occidentalis]|uniref:Uncharacterized protein LOC113212750 n=1 Tax=Frankliniella occidentalis TaxID=133901 RepID=A0A9C6X5C0_FRAOC|nr:uncharacterized protein LOC113212750 [Frankliniella occidentalis]
MGCGSSKGSVVPLEAGGDGAASNGNARALRTGGGTTGGARVPGSGQSRGLSRRPSETPAIQGRDPPEEDLPKDLPELREIVRAAGGKNMAFEVPLSDDKPRPLAPGPFEDTDSGARRPPRRLQRLEDAPLPPSQRLTHQVLDERQEAADERRLQVSSSWALELGPRAGPGPQPGR